MINVCLFCGGNADEPDHLRHCDGRQGHAEATLDLYARRSDPATSHAAMAAFDREVMASARAIAIRLHEAHGPMADYEYEPLFRVTWGRPCSAHLYRQARSAARDQGRIRNSGLTRRNPLSGREQVVWEASADASPLVKRCPTCGRIIARTQPPA